MNMQNKIVLLLFLALLPVELRAQQDSQSTEDSAVMSPLTPNGQAPSLAFKSEALRVNYLSAGVSFTTAFTDNALLSPTAPISDFNYLLQPYLTFSLATPRIDWYLDLGAGLMADQRLNENNLVAKTLGLDLTYRFSEHVSLRLSDTFRDTTGLYSGVTPPAASGIGVVGQPASSLIIPSVQRTQTNASLAELRYQFSPNSVAGVRGTFSLLDYPGSAKDTQFGTLYDSRTYSGEAFYNYHLSIRQWVEVTLGAEKFQVQPSVFTTDSGSLLLDYIVKPIPSVTLSLFAGPEYFDAHQNSVIGNAAGLFAERQWTSAEGATLDWQGGHTRVAASFSRQLGGGAGLSSGVTTQAVSVWLRHQLGSRQELNSSFTYAENIPLVSSPSIHGFSGLVQFQRRLASTLIVLMGYARDHQELPSSLKVANANRAWVSVSYDFLHSFGR